MTILTRERVSITVPEPAVKPELLGVPRIPQRETQQCWAACVDMVLAFLRARHLGVPEVRQCEIANRSRGRTTTGCCQASSGSLCNRPLKDNEITRLWEAFDFKPVRVGQQVRFEFIQGEIKDGRPVQAGLTFDGSGTRGHVIIIHGWNPNKAEPHVFVNDPGRDRGKGQIPFSELQTAYGKGKWDATWTMIER